MPAWTRALYVVAVAIPVATYVVENRRLLGEVETFHRFKMPGEHRLDLAVGDHAIYMESRGRFRGGSFEGGTDRPMSCSIRQPDGNKVVLMTTTESIEYDVGDFAGVLFIELEVERAGEHVMECSYSGTPGSASLMALGPRLDGGKRSRLYLAVSCAAAIVLVGLVLWLRRKP